MTVYGFSSNTRHDDLKRFLICLCWLCLAATFLVAPQAAQAAFDGNFSPDQTMSKNVNISLKGYWQMIAGWGLWVSIAGLLFSIIFAGGKWWWIPVCVFIMSLFGEKAVNQIAVWAGFSAVSGTGA